MSVTTKEDQASALAFDQGTFPFRDPDGSPFDQADLQHMCWAFRGILATPEPAPGSGGGAAMMGL